jgi:hypothetical protein
MKRNMNVREYLIDSCIPIRLACINVDGWPITVSLWYVYLEEKIFCATQRNAKIIEYLSGNPKCGFEVAGDLPPYRGVRGWGYAKLDKVRGVEILSMLIKKYLRDEKSSLANFLLRRNENEMAIEITPLSIFSYDYSDRMKDIVVNTKEV